ncbi:MAG: hypothetical protein GY861_25760 [bacterium]|nr:hypothetical protein [bacterium]
MRKLLAVLLLGLVLGSSTLAQAESTTKARYTAENPYVEQWLNEQDCITHAHDLDKEEKFQKGVGLDLVMYENKAETVALVTEVEHNLSTNVTSMYSKIQVNIWKLFRK